MKTLSIIFLSSTLVASCASETTSDNDAAKGALQRTAREYQRLVLEPGESASLESVAAGGTVDMGFTSSSPTAMEDLATDSAFCVFNPYFGWMSVGMETRTEAGPSIDGPTAYITSLNKQAKRCKFVVKNTSNAEQTLDVWNSQITKRDVPYLPPQPTPDSSVICPADVKICPDGSYVTRTPPTCEFAACAPAPVACTEELKVCPDGSHVARTAPSCEFAPCPSASGFCPQDVKICPDGSTVTRTPPSCAFLPC